MITVLGGSGFIGRHLVERLKERGTVYSVPRRDENLAGRPLGDVIYCIGLTADFRSRPFDTVTAHVGKLLSVLQECTFDSILYLSSTRVYGHRTGTAHEDDSITVEPADPDNLYNISKAMGESLTLTCGKGGRVARLSNVYGDDFGSDNFLASVLRDATEHGKVVFHSTADSEKDYISVNEVVDMLIEIATRGQHQIYNVASGSNLTNLAVGNCLKEAIAAEWEIAPGTARRAFPPISIERIKNEFGFQPGSPLEGIAKLAKAHKPRS